MMIGAYGFRGIAISWLYLTISTCFILLIFGAPLLVSVGLTALIVTVLLGLLNLPGGPDGP